MENPKDKCSGSPALADAPGSAFLARFATPLHLNGCPTLMAVELLRIAKLSQSLRDSPISLLSHLTRWADEINPPNDKLTDAGTKTL
jgi:hypothetical protein